MAGKYLLGAIRRLSASQNDLRIVGVVINEHQHYEGHTLEDHVYFCFVTATGKEIGERQINSLCSKNRKME